MKCSKTAGAGSAWSRAGEIDGIRMLGVKSELSGTVSMALRRRQSGAREWEMISLLVNRDNYMVW